VRSRGKASPRCAAGGDLIDRIERAAGTSAYLLEGLEENYRGLGVDWPANRYVLITLSGDADVKDRKPMQTGVVNGWRCRYDLQTGKFDVPALFSRDNAKAIVPE
jgi:hypothetical protein